MSDQIKTGPVCHCEAYGGSNQFQSFTSSGELFHKETIAGGNGQHLPLPEPSGNVVGVYMGRTTLIGSTDWYQVWLSKPTINNGDTLVVTSTGTPPIFDWTITLNGAVEATGVFNDIG